MRSKYTSFQSCPNAGKGETIHCLLCGYEKTNDYPLEQKCSVRKNHKWISLEEFESQSVEVTK